MTDRELLELAAKAIGRYFVEGESWDDGAGWNPLADDGDALRLAVKLGMDIQTDRIDGLTTVTAGYSLNDLVGVSEPHADDPYTATRRAIVRAAASIGAEK